MTTHSSPEIIFPETRQSFRRLWWLLRVLVCEWLFDLAWRFVPPDYVPITIELAIEAADATSSSASDDRSISREVR